MVARNIDEQQQLLEMLFFTFSGLKLKCWFRLEVVL